MQLSDKRFCKFEALMLLCGMISIVANPLLYTLGPDIYWGNYISGLYSCLFIIVYPLAGCCAWFSFRKVASWWKRAIILSFLVIMLLICSSIWMDMYFYKRWYDRTDVFIGQLHGISILHFTRCNMCLLFQQYQMKKIKTSG